MGTVPYGSQYTKGLSPQIPKGLSLQILKHLVLELKFQQTIPLT